MGEKESAESLEETPEEAGSGIAGEAATGAGEGLAGAGGGDAGAGEGAAAKASGGGGKAQESQRINLNSSKSNTP